MMLRLFLCIMLISAISRGEERGDRNLSENLEHVIKTFVMTYGNADVLGILDDEGYHQATRIGQNNVPRSLSAMSLVFAFSARQTGDTVLRQKAISLLLEVMKRHSLWKSSLLPPEESFNLAPTTGYNVGLAALMLWEFLEDDNKAALRNILTAEADFQLLRRPASGFERDTKAEENCIVPALLVITSFMYPDAEHALQWEAQARCFAYHTITTMNDSQYCGIKTVTTREDFTMDNHGFGPHAVYMAAPLVHFADAALVYVSSEKPVPVEFLHNVLPLWNKLKEMLNEDFTWKGRNSWKPSGLSREVSASSFVSVVLRSDETVEKNLLTHKIAHHGSVVEKPAEPVKEISAYTEDWFNNCIVAQRYVVSWLLHNPSTLSAPLQAKVRRIRE